MEQEYRVPLTNSNHNVLKSMKADTTCRYCNKQVYERESIAVIQYGSVVQYGSVIQYGFCRLWYSHSICFLEVKALMCTLVSVLLCCMCLCYPVPLISIFSPWGFQLPIFFADGCSSAVICFSSGIPAASLSLICSNLLSVSSGVSAASLSHTHCNLVFLSSGISAASLSLIRCSLNFTSSGFSAAILLYFTGTFLLYSSLSFTSSLSGAPGINHCPFAFSPLFNCLCSTLNSVPFVSALSLIFLFLR